MREFEFDRDEEQSAQPAQPELTNESDKTDPAEQNEPIEQTEMSGQDEQPEQSSPADGAVPAAMPTEENPANAAPAQAPADGTIPEQVQRPAAGQTGTNPQYNPYFQGYSRPQQPQYGQPYGQQQNPQNRGYWNSNPYARPVQPQNPGQQGFQNPQNPQTFQNPQNEPYTPGHSYGQNGGQITYTPTPVSAKKPKKPVTRSALAAVVAISLVLSALAGFGGALLADKLSAPKTETAVTAPEKSVLATSGDPVVIYRSVEDAPTSTSGSEGGDLTYAQVATMVKDSVVEINTEYTVYSMWFQYASGGAGSGVILSEDGYIITNNHVVTNESTGEIAETITVRLTDGTEYKAKVVGTDADADIAMLKIEATGLTAAQCGNSDLLTVGEELLVVGNPLGELGGTVSNGIVSATEREIQVEGVTMSLIQTNAAVNPGNSGGGMFNMKGQLVGVVNAKSSGTGIEGLGFAIPINDALNVSEQLLEYGYVRGKTMIGVTFKEMSSNSLFYFYDIKEGVYVESLMEGYNDKALQVGDRVVAVNGDTITSYTDIKAIVSAASVGDKLTFQVERNGKLTEVEVTCFEKVPDTAQEQDIDFGDQKK